MPEIENKSHFAESVLRPFPEISRQHAAAFALAALLNMFCCAAVAQQTLLIGQVTDRASGAPIANANLMFRHTDIGTATDEDGFYVLSADSLKTAIVDITAVGYSPMRVRIKAGHSAALHAALKEEPAELAELIVTPVRDENAWSMVRAAAERHIAPTEYEHSSARAYLSQMTPQMARRRIWKKMQENTGDTSSLIAVYSEHDGAAHAALFHEATYHQLLSPLTAPMDMSGTSLLIGNRACPSPLGKNGRRWYNYYLADSVRTDSATTYVIHYRTRNPYSLSLNGEIRIDSATLRMTSIKASIPPTANINLVREMSISQTFVNDSVCDSRAMLLDFVHQPDSDSRIFPSLYAEARMSSNPNMSSGGDPQSQAAERQIEALRNTPFVKFVAWTATTLITYHAPAGYIDVGDISQIMSFNRHERFRLGVPLRTSASLMRDWVIGAYGAYGFRDKGWKYSAYLQYQTPTELRHQVGASVRNDYTRIGAHPFQYFLLENGTGRGLTDFTTGLLNFMPDSRDYIPERKVSLYTRHDIAQRIEFNARITIGQTGLGQFDSDGKYAYHQWGQFEYFEHHNLLVGLRFSFDDRHLRIHQQRIYLYGQKPVICLGAEIGTYSLRGQGYRPYGRVHATLRQNISAGMAGNIEYAVEAGRIIGEVPYPLLYAFYGNETYAFDRYRFTLMNNMRYAADTYCGLHVLWNMGGLLFNSIPGINRLRLRELVEFKAAYGILKNDHGRVTALPEGLAAMKNPYAEAGVGIGNILGVGDVMFVWRLTNRSDKSAPTWGVRFRLHIEL